jgi:molybdate transport system substrate-binding protein
VNRAAAGAVLVLVLAACGASSSTGSAATPPPTSLTVLAAASLKPPFDQVAAQLKSTANLTVTFNYAGTQTLVAQLSQGAEADVFASADVAHMTTVDKAGLLQGPSQVFAHNSLEIAVAKGNPKSIHSLADLARSGLVIVLADRSVPAGNYAQQILTKAGVTVHPASFEQSVSSVLAKVSIGDADAGIVYSSDITTNNRVDGVPIPDDQNIVAEYPIAVLKSASNATGAKTFVDYVLSGDGQAALKAAGFQPK